MGDGRRRAVFVVLLAMLSGGWQQTPQPVCASTGRSALAAAEVQVARGDDAAALTALVAVGQSDACPEVAVARAALAAWVEARKVVQFAGAKESLGAVQRSLADLQAQTTAAVSIEGQYATAAARAAVAAAQDERDEMNLWLTHARDLSERLVTRGRRAVWPRSFNVLSGELWFEVDRYEDARRAFVRALQGNATAVARAGLALSLERLGEHGEACRTAATIGDAAPPLAARLRAEVTGCP